MPGHLPVAERRSQLLDAAQQVARRDGIAGVTVRAVADQAAVAAGVVHYCFEDKRALLTALSHRLVEQNTFGGALPDELDTWLAQAGATDFGPAVRRGLDALWQAAAATRPDQLLTYELMTLALRDESARAAARAQFELGQDAAERLLSAVAAACEVQFLRPVADLAGESLAWFDGAVLRWLLDNDADRVQVRLDALAAHLEAATAPIEAAAERVDTLAAGSGRADSQHHNGHR